MGWRDRAEVIAPVAPVEGWRTRAEVVDTSQTNSGTQNAMRLRGRAEGIGRAVADTADTLAGSPIKDAQAFGARMGDAFGRADGFVDTAANLATEALRGVPGTVAELATGGPLGAPLRSAIGDLRRPVGEAIGADIMAPAEQTFRDEQTAQIADDARRDPTGTGVAKAATIAASLLPAAPAALRGIAGGLRSVGPLAETAEQVAVEFAKDAPGIRVLTKVSAIHEAAKAVKPAVEKLASMKRFGVPEAQQGEFLRLFRAKHGPEFMDKVAKAAGVSTKGL